MYSAECLGILLGANCCSKHELLLAESPKRNCCSRLWSVLVKAPNKQLAKGGEDCWKFRIVRSFWIYAYHGRAKISLFFTDNIFFFINVPGDLLDHCCLLLINSLPCWWGQWNGEGWGVVLELGAFQVVWFKAKIYYWKCFNILVKESWDSNYRLQWNFLKC